MAQLFGLEGLNRTETAITPRRRSLRRCRPWNDSTHRPILGNAQRRVHFSTITRQRAIDEANLLDVGMAPSEDPRGVESVQSQGSALALCTAGCAAAARRRGGCGYSRALVSTG